MNSERGYVQHGNISVYDHSLRVARMCIRTALTLGADVDMRSLVRGAFLHDYFLYDWHCPDKSHRLHGFTHAGRALDNAAADFDLNDIERDMIRTHMFPLNPRLPGYRESYILTLSDKLCALGETASGIRRHRRTAGK